MAGTIIADKIQTENAFLTLNVGQTLVATINSSGILNSSGGTMIGANGSVSNTAITGLVTASQIATVANTQITGNIVSSQIAPSVTLTTPIISGNLNLDSAGTTGIRVPTANIISFHTAGTEDMRIDATGNVGVGTSSPTEKLDVRANATFGSATGTDASIHIQSGYDVGLKYLTRLSTDYNGVFSMHNGSTATANTPSSAALTERMRIDSSGNMGINTSSPAHKLDVQSNFEGAIVRILNNRDTTGSYGIKVTLGASGGAGTTGSAHFHGNTNAVGNWYLYGNGTTSYSSDQRLKKNIESARDGYLEDLCRLRVVKYNWNASLQDAPKELGLIAQEVEQVFPGLVQDDANPVTEGDDTAYKQLKQSVLPFMLLKAIQEQQAIISDLKARIEALEA